MNTKLQQALQRFANRHSLDKFQAMMDMLRLARKTPRNQTYKSAFSMGYRGFPRTMTPRGRIKAPTIDQVRRLERAYMCKLHVKDGGLLYFRDGTPFTHERGRAYRYEVMQEKLAECA